MSTVDDFLSPFDELVLTAIAELGYGRSNAAISRKVRELSGREEISFTRVLFTLKQLEKDCCVYSWTQDARFKNPEAFGLQRYRIQNRGERALRAAIDRRGKATPEYFYRASRFGILWDIWRGVRCRKRAGWWPLFEGIDGHGENI